MYLGLLPERPGPASSTTPPGPLPAFSQSACIPRRNCRFMAVLRRAAVGDTRATASTLLVSPLAPEMTPVAVFSSSRLSAETEMARRHAILWTPYGSHESRPPRAAACHLFACLVDGCRDTNLLHTRCGSLETGAS